eukprot:scaffold27954_cov70-Phaeocystis_antarctica.AAC.6
MSHTGEEGGDEGGEGGKGGEGGSEGGEGGEDGVGGAEGGAGSSRGRGVGEARAVGGRLALLPALLHCVEAARFNVPRVAAAGIPAVAHTQSHRPRGSRRRRGRRGERGWRGRRRGRRGLRGRRRLVTGAVATGAVPTIFSGHVGAVQTIGGPNCIAAGCTVGAVVNGACNAYFRQDTPHRHSFRDQCLASQVFRPPRRRAAWAGGITRRLGRGVTRRRGFCRTVGGGE